MPDDVERLLERAGRLTVDPVEANAVWTTGRRRRAVVQTVRYVAVSLAVIVIAAPVGIAVLDRATGTTVDIADAPDGSSLQPDLCETPGATDAERIATREDAAVALAATLEDAGYELPLDPPDRFSDDDRSPAARSLDQLAALGIVHGTRSNADEYAPADPLTKGQLASLTVRAYERLSGLELATGATSPEYRDDPHAADFDKAKRSGLFPTNLGPGAAAAAAATTADLHTALDRLRLRLAEPSGGPACMSTAPG